MRNNSGIEMLGRFSPVSAPQIFPSEIPLVILPVNRTREPRFLLPDIPPNTLLAYSSYTVPLFYTLLALRRSAKHCVV